MSLRMAHLTDTCCMHPDTRPCEVRGRFDLKVIGTCCLARRDMCMRGGMGFGVGLYLGCVYLRYGTRGGMACWLNFRLRVLCVGHGMGARIAIGGGWIDWLAEAGGRRSANRGGRSERGTATNDDGRSSVGRAVSLRLTLI